MLDLEKIGEHHDTYVGRIASFRMKVHGGWIVTTVVHSSTPNDKSARSLDTAFVPDPRHEWVPQRCEVPGE